MSPGSRLRAIETQKKVSDGLAPAQGDPTPPAVLFAVVQQMAPLAQGLQIAQPVVARIMVQMGRREHDPRGAKRDLLAHSDEAGQSPPASIPPGLVVRIPPSTIA